MSNNPEIWNQSKISRTLRKRGQFYNFRSDFIKVFVSTEKLPARERRHVKEKRIICSLKVPTHTRNNNTL